MPMSDPERPAADDPRDTVVILAGQPVSRQALRDAGRVLSGMQDIQAPHVRPAPAWITAARLAVRDALRDEAPDTEADP
jgi:hypothetical protein